MNYLTLVIGVFLLLSCTKTPIEIEPEYTRCENNYSPSNSQRLNIGNGYTIDFPSDTVNCFSQLEPPILFTCYSENHSVGIQFGACNLNFSTDPPCGDFQFFNFKDSIKIPSLRDTSLSHYFAGARFKYYNGYLLCQDGQEYAAIYSHFNYDSTHLSGAIYLKNHQDNVLYYGGRFGTRVEYLNLVDSILHSIKPE